jgi:hypothetical protein
VATLKILDKGVAVFAAVLEGFRRQKLARMIVLNLLQIASSAPGRQPA